jgi:hypothetical protein
MWLLSFLPSWAVHLMVVAGVGGIVVSFILGVIPFISTYKLPIQLISIILLVAGVWFEGGISNQAAWEVRVAELKVKVAEAEARSANANVEVVTNVVTKTKTIHDKGADIISYVDREVIKNVEVIKFIENCPIPTIIVNTHNAAALNKPIEAIK